VDTIDHIIAIEQIKQLKARYFRLMDTRDWDGFAAVFAADAVFDLSEVNSVFNPVTRRWHPAFDGKNVFTGREAILAMVRAALDGMISVHHGCMPEIEITGETTARGIWAMRDTIYNAPGSREFYMEGYGHYHEQYVRSGAGWVIKHIKITRLLLKGGEFHPEEQ